MFAFVHVHIFKVNRLHVRPDRLVCEYLLFLSYWEGCVSLTVSLPLLLSLQPAAAVYLF